MAGLFPTTPDTMEPVSYPGQKNQTGDTHALMIAEYAGMVEHTIDRKSVLADMIPRRTIRGTNTIRNYAFGEATLGKVTPGVAPAASGVDISKAELTVDTVIYGRSIFPLLDVFQTEYDARKEVATEHGKKIAKFTDQAFFIQAAKTALLTESRYNDGGASGKPAGHFGGSTQTLTNSADVTDPAKMYAAVSSLHTKMAEKDVDWLEDDIMLAFRPAVFAALRDSEQIQNGMYRTADGTEKQGLVFKALGAPVFQSNNIPNTNVTGHLLSNAGNSNAYDGDFSKLAGLAFSAKALLAGETIPQESDIFYDKIYKMWFVDTHLAFGVTGNRAEYAGAILLP